MVEEKDNIKKDVTFEKALDDLLESIKNMLLIKRNDYGLTFQESCDKYGLMSPIVRLNDKLDRISNLYMNKKIIKNESIDDSFKDIIGYSILSLLWRKGVR